MATSDDPTGSPKLEFSTHPLFELLNPRGDSPPTDVPLIGFVGPSSKPENVRLYLDLSFTGYIEMPIAGVISSQPVNKQDENSPTLVVVPDSMKLEVVQTQAQTVEASYLRGWIAQVAAKASSQAPASMTHVAAQADSKMLSGTFEMGCYTLSSTLCLTCSPTFYPCWPKQ